MSYYVVYHITVLLIIGTAVETPVPPDCDQQRVSLSSNNSAPCYNDTVDLICHYPCPDVFSDLQGNWEWNKERLYHDGSLFQRKVINQTTSRLRVRIDPANFTGDPVSFTCYRVRNSTAGVIDNATTLVDPQDVAKPPILAEPMVNGSSARISWSHTDKGLCFHNLTFSYNITWYPVKGEKTQSNTTRPGATEYTITNLMRNSDYQVDLVGFTSSEPPMHSETAVVNFTTKAPDDPGDLPIIVYVLTALVAAICLVFIIMLVRNNESCHSKLHQLYDCFVKKVKKKDAESEKGQKLAV